MGVCILKCEQFHGESLRVTNQDPQKLLTTETMRGNGAGELQGTGPGTMDTNMLCRNVRIGPRQGYELESIVSFCAGPLPCTCTGPIFRAVWISHAVILVA